MFNAYKYRDSKRPQPTVRIQGIILENFKSVKYGKVEFNCAKQFVEEGTGSDILGVYGQNGSGKTSIIEALAITKALMSGDPCLPIYADCIAEKAANARVTVTFEFQYPNRDIKIVQYSYSMRRREMSEEDSIEIKKLLKNIINDESLIPEFRSEVEIFDERIKLSEKLHDGKRVKAQTIIETTTKKSFGPVSKRKEYCDCKKNTMFDLALIRSRTNECSSSFIFNEKTIECFNRTGNDSDYYNVLIEMVIFASRYFYVVDTKSAAMIQSNAALPIFLPDGEMMFSLFKPVFVEDEDTDFIEKNIEELSRLLTALIPDMALNLHEVSKGMDDEGNHGSWVELLSVRNGCEMPIRYESDGIKRIISEILLIKNVYNQKSTTVAIDEFDAGIFEYLLGEILSLIEDSGKGQFIFTSHNLRPLEVIDKKYLCFTTTNSENRYYRFKNVGNTNNLRKTYYREIMVGEQDEELYMRAKKHRILAAFKEYDAEETM